MLQALLPTMGWYIVFSFFAFHQQLHAKHFGGDSQGYATALAIAGFMAMITGFVYLGMLAFQAAWWAPFPVFVAGTAVTGFASGLFVKGAGKLAIVGLLGFAGWPVSAYLMFSSIPS